LAQDLASRLEPAQSYLDFWVAMAAYESAQLIEHAPDGVAAPKQKAKPWRKIGLVMAAMATIAVATGAMTLRSRTSTPVERMHRLHKGLMRAFSKRALQEAADLTATFDFTWAEEGQDDPNAMGLVAEISEGTSELDHLQISTVFAAKEGKGADLAAQFQKVIDGVVQYLEAMQGEGAGGMVTSMVSVAQVGDEDSVVINVTPPPPPGLEDAAEEMDGALEVKPHFHAELNFGRTIQSMFENIDDNLAILPHGIKGHVTASFAHTLFKAVEDEMGGPPMGMGGPPSPRGLQGGGRGPPIPDPMMLMGAMSNVNTVQEFRYRSGGKALEAFDQLPSLGAGVKYFASEFAKGPETILAPMHGLADLADGVKSMTVSGLPNNFEIVMSFTNVHVTPLLKEIIGDIDAARAPPAAEGGAGEVDGQPAEVDGEPAE